MFFKILELISTLKVINSLRKSAKGALAISQFFICEPLISSEHAILYFINQTLLLGRSKILSGVTENVS